MRFHLLSVFWGEEFTDRFARVALRSLLAPGNLPAVASTHRLVHHIHTTAADADRLSANPIFKEAQRYAEYRMHTVSLTETERRNPGSHWILWHRGAAQLDGPDDVLITVAPDHLFSRDTMARWAALFLGGRLAVFCPGVQVVLETLQEEIERSFPAPSPIDVGIDDLHAMMFRHLHPMKVTMLRGSPRCILHPEEHLRPIDGYGFVQNVLGSHAVAFRPRAIRVNRHFCPVEHLDRVAFEPCQYLSLEPALKALSLYLHPWRLDDAALNQFGEWADVYLFDVNLRESRTAHVYALGRSIPLPERRRAELASRSFVAQMHAARGVFKLWRALREAGRSRAALWLAAAHTHARLRRRLAPRLPATIFVPEESVLGRLEAGERARLLASEGRALIALLRAHVAEGRHTLVRGNRLIRADGGAIRMMDGACYSVARDGEVRVTAGPIHVEDMDVYVISRPLVPLPLDFPRVTDVPLVRWVLDGSAQWLRRSNSGARQLLREFPRLHASVVGLRDAWYSRFGRGAPAAADVMDGSSPALAAYSRALACRTADALRQLYGFYRDTVLAGTGVGVSPEARFIGPDAPGESASELLWSAVQSAPRFSEAWLELGFARLDAGHPETAIEAFERASTLPPVLPARPHDPDPRLVAALERARLLISRNQLPDALAALEAVPLVRPVPRTFHAVRARLLLHAGRIDQALQEFSHCMTGYAAFPSFGDLLPRDADALDATLKDAAPAQHRSPEKRASS
jgi:tetratricopeptide (TPR) repeat protein